MLISSNNTGNCFNDYLITDYTNMICAMYNCPFEWVTTMSPLKANFRTSLIHSFVAITIDDFRWSVGEAFVIVKLFRCRITQAIEAVGGHIWRWPVKGYVPELSIALWISSISENLLIVICSVFFSRSGYNHCVTPHSRTR